jgi:hypothetical protein
MKLAVGKKGNASMQKIIRLVLFPILLLLVTVSTVFFFIKENEKTVSFFKYVHVPDEVFFQTILMNFYSKPETTQENARHIEWSNLKPRVFQVNDFNSLIASDKLFARKFASGKENGILQLIDNYISAKKA